MIRKVMIVVVVIVILPTAILFGGYVSSSNINGHLSANNENQDRVLDLTDFDFQNESSIYELIESRVASNTFSDKEISFETRSKIIWATHGMTYSGGKKTMHGLDAVSSATEVPRYTINPASLERYINIYYLGDEGSYEYIPEENALKRISEKNLVDIATNSGRNSQFRILLTIDEEIYSFSEKWAYLALGSSIQNVNLIANAEDVHVFTQGYFNDSDLSKELGLKASEEPGVLLSFGYMH